MSPRDELADAIERLKSLRAAPRDAGAVDELRALLGSKNSLVVSRAAKLVGELRLPDLAEDLSAAFERFEQSPDKGAHAKTECARALYELDHQADALFDRAIRMRQLEPGFGQATDVAVELRGIAAFALVRSDPLRALVPLADLLADPEDAARSAAARALVDAGSHALPLLRLKARHGDAEPQVTSDCFVSLLAIDASGQAPFVASFLDSKREDDVLSASWALSATPTHEAFVALRDAWTRAHGSARVPLARALCGMRFDEAREFLLDRIAREVTPVAVELIAALDVYREDEEFLERLHAAIEDRDELGLRLAYRDTFGA